jgi:hypothetical protein
LTPATFEVFHVQFSDIASVNLGDRFGKLGILSLATIEKLQRRLNDFGRIAKNAGGHLGVDKALLRWSELNHFRVIPGFADDTQLRVIAKV